jgi:predicted nucleotidyltransferase
MGSGMAHRIDAASSTPPGEESLLHVLDESVAALREAGIQFLMIGGVASTMLGRDRGTTDIDVLVRPDAAPRGLQALARRGFDTEIKDEHWLFKGTMDGIDVDLIFRASRDVLLDEEMLRRASTGEFRGRELPVAPPEDLIIMKAIAFDEDTPRYWFDAVAMLSHPGIDWEYLTLRARQHGIRRILSLLLYATSIDLAVPSWPVVDLWETIRAGEDAGPDRRIEAPLR